MDLEDMDDGLLELVTAIVSQQILDRGDVIVTQEGIVFVGMDIE